MTASTPPNDQAEYSLDQLSKESGVTPRTVRYYVAEGLLPPPVTTGRYATYSQEHVDRLHAIGVLKEMYLPLREIRHRLSTLTRDQMRDPAFLATLSQIAAVDRASERARSEPVRANEDSAASYLQRHAPHQQEPARQPRAYAPSAPMPAPAPPAADTWERFQVTRDAELLIRSDRVHRLGRRLRQTLFEIGQIIESADDHERNRS